MCGLRDILVSRHTDRPICLWQYHAALLVIIVVCILLLQLDCDEDGGLRGEEDEPDFYVQAHMPV